LSDRETPQDYHLVHSTRISQQIRQLELTMEKRDRFVYFITQHRKFTGEIQGHNYEIVRVWHLARSRL